MSAIQVSGKHWAVRILAVGAFGGLLTLLFVFGSAREVAADAAASQGPATSGIQATFADAVSASPDWLQAARQAASKGDVELAIQDYQLSIQDQADSAETAIDEFGGLFLGAAKQAHSDERFFAESSWLNRGNQDLQQLSHIESAKALPGSARVKLFEQIKNLKLACSEAAKGHVEAADRLRQEAKGAHFWNSDDSEKQMDALHRVNLAWSYYPNYTDESVVNAMYEIHADMKSTLKTWRYEQVMERDRLQLGRAFGDR